MKLLLDLFFTFAKVGMFTFGGGYAMISIIEDICVNKKQWITHEQMLRDMRFMEACFYSAEHNCVVTDFE